RILIEKRSSLSCFVAVYAPKIFPLSTVPLIKEGSRFSSTCSTSEGTEPLLFRWHKDGKDISKSRIRIETSSLISTLMIDSVSREDIGNYTCFVSNSAGEDSKSFSLSVNVPIKWTEEPEDKKVSLGKEITINCHAEGLPFPTVKWIDANTQKKQ
ncbi:Down syndrome cell adhesion molecule-like protein 1-like protein, partial [Leptotrombidium deliense]